VCKVRRLSALSLGLLIVLPCDARSSESVPDGIYIHGDILTGEGLTGSAPQRVSALAVRAGRVLAAGRDDDLLKSKTASTRVLDLHGAFVIPGFNDAHLHFASAGLTKLKVDLTGTKSLDEMLSRIRRAVAGARQGTWIEGLGWDHTFWMPAQPPSRADLDRVTANHPAIFDRIDGHIAVANTLALRAGGIGKGTSDPPGGKIDRDANGEPTGILREAAKEQLWAKVPPPTPKERRQALELALTDAVTHGLTSAQDYSSWDDFEVYEQMEREGKLPLRISEWLTFNDPLPTLIRERASHPADDPMLHTGMLKGFMDGSLGSRTAALKAPYSDDPDNRGIPQYDQAELNRMTVVRAKADFRIGFHAIGDQAVRMALDAFAAAEAAVPDKKPSDFRFRIEHDQVIDPQDLPLQARLRVIASMQPNHLLSDMRWALQRIGPVRARYSYAWKSMLDHGIPLAFGTDYPVEQVTPFRGLYAAVARRAEPGSPVAADTLYFPEERLTLAQAVYAYTQGAAYAEGTERQKGRLVPGYLADFVVLDRDLFKATPEEILNTRVLLVVVDGRTVYQAARQ
jgi:predicted amidohydrolase YtcJ